MAATVSMTIHHCHKLLNYRIAPCRLFASLAGARAGRTMASSGVGEYTTISEKISFDKEIKKSKFIAIAGHVSDDQSAQSFLSQVRDPRATHNCWAYKIGEQYRSNDDGEPSGTAGKPIYSAIASSGIDRVMVVVIRSFGGIKLGTGGLVRAYDGVTSECLRNAPTHLVKSKLQSFHVEDMKQDYDTGKESTCMVTFKVEYDQVEKLEEAVLANCSRDIVFFKRCIEIPSSGKITDEERKQLPLATHSPLLERDLFQNLSCEQDC